MPRIVAVVTGLLYLAVVTCVLLTGCGGSIETAPLPSSTVAPFDTTTGKWLVGREGVELVNFKEDFQTNFTHQLVDRLNKLAPSEQRWVDLPDHGWLVAGQFITVDQGSRAERSLVGMGLGETTMQANVYVYDLDVSKTQYILAFRTGVPDKDNDTGAGSGSLPSGFGAPEPVLTGMGIGSGLKLDTTRTCREIAAILQQYM